MNLVQNFPFITILLCLAGGVLSSVLSAKKARRFCFFLLGVVGVLSAFTFYDALMRKEPYVYYMGHFPAPWGNEIRIGILESFMAVFFCVIMLLSLSGGLYKIIEEVEETKQNLYWTMISLLMSSMLALIYTNDLFTAYVFVEINTIAAAGLIMIRNNGHSIVAATKYMIMSLVGSGMLLLSISLLYDLTGHLLMSNMRMEIATIAKTGEYQVPLTVIIALICVGIAIKSALFPFHTWLPEAYGYSTASSSAILSSLVSKSYIFLLLKVFYRVIGMEVITAHGTNYILFCFAIAGMMMGSFNAIKEHDMRRMVAYSSIAQIGYIYMGIGFGSQAGMIAAVFHILSHSASKALLFITTAGLSSVSGDSKEFRDLKGAGIRNKMAGLGFCVGAFSMVGIPLFAGFISKVYFAEAAFTASPIQMGVGMAALAISTILNAVYFMRAVILLYTPSKKRERDGKFQNRISFHSSVSIFISLNFILGFGSYYIIRMIEQGLSRFA